MTTARVAQDGADAPEAYPTALLHYRALFQDALTGLAADANRGDRRGWCPAPERVADESDVLGALCTSAIEEALVAAAWWSVADPGLATAFGHLHDDAGRRYPSLAILRLLLVHHGLRIPLALPTDSGIVAAGVLRPVPDAESPIRLTATAALALDGYRPAVQPVEPVTPRLRNPVARAAALLQAGHRVCVRCGDSEDGAVVATAVAAATGRHVEFVDTAPAAERPVAETELLARLGHVLAVGAGSHPATALRLADAGAAVSPGWQTVDVAPIDNDGVHRAWRRVLGHCGLDTSAAGELAARMRLPEATIDSLHHSARAAAEVAGRHVTIADLHNAVRAHPQHRIEGLARLLPPSVRLRDLVFTDETRTGLHDILAHARHSAAVTSAWPGGAVRGRAVIGLFHGPSGTGKTAAAEALAAELDRDLWIVDLARVVSKWLGETSHNIDRLLTESARGGAVLLFDEAEGVFGRRGEITDARDRYANLEIDHLLQRVELHDGLVLLATNRPAALDDGFQRRIRVSVRFDLPDVQARLAIWNTLLPTPTCADDVDLSAVADAELSGACIRAAALAALVFAADDATPVTNAHLLHAIRHEMAKNGRTWRQR